MCVCVLCRQISDKRPNQLTGVFFSLFFVVLSNFVVLSYAFGCVTMRSTYLSGCHRAILTTTTWNWIFRRHWHTHTHTRCLCLHLVVRRQNGRRFESKSRYTIVISHWSTLNSISYRFDSFHIRTEQFRTLAVSFKYM